MGFLPTPNSDGECCENPCELEDPCDPCDAECPCVNNRPDKVVIVSYEEQIVGDEGCQKKVYVVTGCTNRSFSECDEDSITYNGGLSYVASPVNKWFIGGAVSQKNGCSGLYGEYKQNGVLAYKVTTEKPNSTGETIIGDLTDDSDCKDCPPPCCDSGSGVGSGVTPPPVCQSGVSECCASGVPACSGDQPCCSSGIPTCDEVSNPCGSGLTGSGVNGSGPCDPCCDETNDCDPDPCCDQPDPCNPPDCCSEGDDCGGDCEDMTFDEDQVPDSGCP